MPIEGEGKENSKNPCLLLWVIFISVHEPFQPFLVWTMQLVHVYNNYEVNSFTGNDLVVFSWFLFISTRFLNQGFGK